MNARVAPHSVQAKKPLVAILTAIECHFLDPDHCELFYGNWRSNVMIADFSRGTPAPLQAPLANSCLSFFLNRFLSSLNVVSSSNRRKEYLVLLADVSMPLDQSGWAVVYSPSTDLRQMPVSNGVQRTHLTASECHQSLHHLQKAIQKSCTKCHDSRFCDHCSSRCTSRPKRFLFAVFPNSIPVSSTVAS